jgi:hypothetical protein
VEIGNKCFAGSNRQIEGGHWRMTLPVDQAQFEKSGRIEGRKVQRSLNI